MIECKDNYVCATKSEPINIIALPIFQNDL